MAGCLPHLVAGIPGSLRKFPVDMVYILRLPSHGAPLGHSFCRWHDYPKNHIQQKQKSAPLHMDPEQSPYKKGWGGKHYCNKNKYDSHPYSIHPEVCSQSAADTCYYGILGIPVDSSLYRFCRSLSSAVIYLGRASQNGNDLVYVPILYNTVSAASLYKEFCNALLNIIYNLCLLLAVMGSQLCQISLQKGISILLYGKRNAL